MATPVLPDEDFWFVVLALDENASAEMRQAFAGGLDWHRGSQAVWGYSRARTRVEAVERMIDSVGNLSGVEVIATALLSDVEAGDPR